MTATTVENVKLDKDTLATKAAEAVSIELATTKDDRNLLRAATAVIDADTKTFEELGRHRENLILSLVMHEGRSALSVAEDAGVSRSLLTKMLNNRLGGEAGVYRLTGKSLEDLRADAGKAKVRRFSTAAGDLPEVARKVIESRARADKAREYRDVAVRRLVGSGAMTQAEVARETGMTHAAVSHLVTGRRGKATPV